MTVPKPIHIFYTKDFTTILSASKHPIKETKWNTIKDTKTLKEIKDVSPRFGYELKPEPLDLEKVSVEISHQLVIRGRRHKTTKNIFSFYNFIFISKAGRHEIIIRFDTLVKLLEVKGVKDSHPIQIKINYQEK